MEAAGQLGLAPFVTAQNRYSLITRDIEADLVPVCTARNVAVLPYFPLESGLLTGKYRPGEPLPEGSRFAKWRGGGSFASDARYAQVARLRAWGDARGVSVLDIAIGWLTARPWVGSVIAGVTRPEQLRANVVAAAYAPDATADREIEALLSGP
jgi:aryl-alcohol dehydrogenase-like predicted oxidoreductase